MNFLNLTHNLLLILFMIGLSVLAACEPSQTGLLRDPGGVMSDSAPYTHGLGSQILSSYSGSYALLIGESQYTNGWGHLGSIPSELRQVEQVLKSQGFTVEKSFNLNSRQLKNRFEKFVDDYGFDKNNRLLFFYSGHGHTREDKGYIVPVDAANPNVDEKAFLRKAVGMNQILTWARRIEAKHVLFLFDSCFSGTVFKARNLRKVPRQISQAAKEPVRQFITAGRADETVPAKSVFAPAFVDALRYGWGDLYKDGYVTGEELGLYLTNKVPEHSDQTPQYGKIKDYELSRGDFVFVVAGDNQDVAQSPTSMPVAPVPAPIPILKPAPVVSTHSSYRYDPLIIDEIKWIINANFGGYTKSDPLRVYVSPFKPHYEWEESEIGKIAWQGAAGGTKDVAFFSDGRIVFVGPQTRGYYGVDEEVYNSALETDGFWTTTGGSVRKRLKRLASRRNANSIIYGIYDGDDNSLKLSIYLYAKVDDVILKERMEAQTQFMVVSGLIKGKQSGRKLTKAEEELQKMIHEKVKFSTAKLLRKYMEGR